MIIPKFTYWPELYFRLLGEKSVTILYVTSHVWQLLQEETNEREVKLIPQRYIP